MGPFRVRNVSDKSYREFKNTYFIFMNFPEYRFVYAMMRKNMVRAGQVTDDNAAHAHCMLDT